MTKHSVEQVDAADLRVGDVLAVDGHRETVQHIELAPEYDDAHILTDIEGGGIGEWSFHTGSPVERIVP